MTFLEDIEVISKEFDENISNSYFKICESLSEYFKSIDDETLIAEAVRPDHEGIITKLKKFFIHLINSIITFTKNLKNTVNTHIETMKIKRKLKKIHEKASKLDKNAKVEVVNIWTLKDDYVSIANRLYKLSNKMTKMKYKHLSELDDEIAKFNRLIDESEKILNEDLNKKVTVKAEDLVNFVEDEITKRSTVITTLNTNILLVEEMKLECENIIRKREFLGPDILKKVSGLKDIASKISKFFRKWVAKILATFIMFFA